MSEVQELLRHYAEVRNRLKRPANAVPDTGINLRRNKQGGSPAPLSGHIDSKVQLTPDQLSRLETYRNSFCRHDVMTFKSILKFVADDFGLRYSYLISRTRIKPVIIPRQIAFYLGYTVGGHSLAGMARFMDMDHTTVIHGKNQVKAKVASDPEFQAKISDMGARLCANFNRSSHSALDQPALAVESGPGSSLSAIFPVDNSSGPTFNGPEERPNQDVAGELHCPTTDILEIPETPERCG